MNDDLKILLIFTPKVGYQHDVLEGIRQYTARLPKWSLKGVHQNHPGIAGLIKRWRPDGIIGLIEHEGLAAGIRKLGIPSVDVAGCIRHPLGGQVHIDDLQVGQIAAEFFLAQGFRNFGFFGESTALFSQERLRGFTATLEAAGAECKTQFLSNPEKQFDRTAEWFGANHGLADWLQELPRPAAVLCSHDQHGLVLLNTCRQYDLSVPFDISVLGVDDNTLMCHLASPSLSSIRQSGIQIGFRAAKLLDDIINAQADPHTNITLETPGIVQRDSTRHNAIEDSDVVGVMKIIHDNCGRRIRIGDLIGSAAISRRALEMKFHRALGHGIWAEVQRTRVEMAKKLMRETDMKMSAIARRVGFTSGAHLTEAFQRIAGSLPSVYRRRMRYPEDTNGITEI